LIAAKRVTTRTVLATEKSEKRGGEKEKFRGKKRTSKTPNANVGAKTRPKKNEKSQKEKTKQGGKQNAERS